MNNKFNTAKLANPNRFVLHKYGKVVQFSINDSVSEEIISGEDIATLPNEYIPFGVVVGVPVFDSIQNLVIGKLQIKTDGNIRYFGNTITSGTLIDINASYVSSN